MAVKGRYMTEKPKYIDIKEAMVLTGKSESTIRNLLRSLSKSEREKYTTRKGQKVFILQSLVEERHGRVDAPKTNFERRTLEVLERQLTAKDEQLAAKQKTIDELVQRLKEQNYNQGSLYKFLNDLGLSENEIQKALK